MPMDLAWPDNGPIAVWSACILLGGTLLWLWQRYKAQYSYYTAPSPRIRPLWAAFGHVELTERVADRHKLYLEWHEQLGPFVRIRIAHRSMLMVADAAAASSILIKGPGYVARKPPEYTAFDVAHGLQGFNGMLTHQDEGTWRAARRAITPAFALSEVKKQYPVMLSCLTEMLAGIDASLAAGQPDIEIEHRLLVATNTLIASAFLQLPKRFIDPEQLAADVSFIMGAASRYICEPWRWFGHLYLPFLTQEGRHMWSARRRLAANAERVYDLLHERYAASPPAEFDNTLAACLMRITDKHGNKPKRGALVAEICDALTASETVPSTVMWTLYCIATRPDLQQQLHQELSTSGITSSSNISRTTTNGRHSSETPQQEDDIHRTSDKQHGSSSGVPSKGTPKQQRQQQPADAAELQQQRREQLHDTFAAGGPDLLKGLPLLQACLYEAMRLFPAGAPGAPRLTEAPTQVGPYLVPPGVIVFPNLFTIMNYSKNWPDQPDQFQPSRWQVAEGGQQPDKDPVTGAARWVPFSLGPKACAGQNLALLQSKAALAMLLAGYEWSLAPRMGGEEGVAARTYLGVTIKVRNGLWLTAKPRLW